MIFGDFNAVRNTSERAGSIFVERVANAFNDFISCAGLHDIQINGRRFTYFSKRGNKMSKLDRFLVSSKFLDIWPEVSVLALERYISDHCPLLLSIGVKGFGPKPFKFFDVWMDHPEFLDTVQKSWNQEIIGNKADIILKNKLKRLKSDLKVWSHGLRKP